MDPRQPGDDDFDMEATNPIPTVKKGGRMTGRPKKKRPVGEKKEKRREEVYYEAPAAPEKSQRSSHRYLLVLLIVFLVTILYTAYLFRGFLGKGAPVEPQPHKDFELVDPASQGISIE